MSSKCVRRLLKYRSWLINFCFVSGAPCIHGSMGDRLLHVGVRACVRVPYAVVACYTRRWRVGWAGAAARSLLALLSHCPRTAAATAAAAAQRR